MQGSLPAGTHGAPCRAVETCGPYTRARQRSPSAPPQRCPICTACATPTHGARRTSLIHTRLKADRHELQTVPRRMAPGPLRMRLLAMVSNLDHAKPHKATHRSTKR